MESITFFETPAEFRAWLEQNHREATELWVGFKKTHTGEPSMTWPESVDEALCFGWIDALRRSLGPTSYTIRFVPRKRTSAWSAVNMKRVPELIAEGRMREAGLAAWELRAHSKLSNYTYDGPTRYLGESEVAQFKNHPEGWAYFQAQSPSYQKQVSHWIMNAKREETKASRLATLISDCDQGRKVEAYTKYSKKGS